jgi:hypothetical protein
MSTEVLYNISDFTSIKDEGFVFNLQQSVIDIIQSISNQVGAPEYIRTPQFSKQKTDKHANTVDWEEMRNFKVTKFAEKKGTQVHIDNIRKHVNKITAKTYESLSAKIIQEIASIGDIDNPDELNESIYKDIGESIFTIASTNMFYSDIYARLYKNLMDEFPFMINIFDDNFTKCSDVYKTIEYCSPNEDYDKYCDINKANDKRRSISMFYINLMKLDVIKASAIIKIIKDIQSYLFTLYTSEDSKAIVDELSEVIYILVINSYSILKLNDEWCIINDNIIEITKSNTTNFHGLTNKCIFKHMDILDEIAKQNASS